MPTKLSAAIITRNEARNIADCLQSLAFVDEIVILDSGSTDATAEIAERFPVRFLSRPFDNFSAQKNAAMAQTTGEWILLIDADERVTAELAAEINRTLENPACDGYWLRRNNFIFGHQMRYGASSKDFQLRLVRRNKGLFEGLVHERIQLHGKSGFLTAPLEHYSTRNLEDYFRRFAPYTALEAEKIHHQGIRPNAVHILLKPVWDFIYFYFFRLGFLDGLAGLQYQILSSFYISVKYMKALELFKKDSHLMREKVAV